MGYGGIFTCRLAMYAIASLILWTGSARAELILAAEPLPPQLLVDDRLMTVLELFGTSYNNVDVSGCSYESYAHNNHWPIECPSNARSLGGSSDGCDDGTNSTSNNRSSSSSGILCWLMHLKPPVLLERLSRFDKCKAPFAPTFEKLRPS